MSGGGVELDTLSLGALSDISVGKKKTPLESVPADTSELDEFIIIAAGWVMAALGDFFILTKVCDG